MRSTVADERCVQQHAARSVGVQFRQELLEARECSRTQTARVREPAQRLAHGRVRLDDIKHRWPGLITLRKHRILCPGVGRDRTPASDAAVSDLGRIGRRPASGRDGCAGTLAKSDQVGYRPCFQLGHDLGPMLLHGRFADRQPVGDLLVEPARDDFTEHVTLASR